MCRHVKRGRVPIRSVEERKTNSFLHVRVVGVPILQKGGWEHGDGAPKQSVDILQSMATRQSLTGLQQSEQRRQHCQLVGLIPFDDWIQVHQDIAILFVLFGFELSFVGWVIEMWGGGGKGEGDGLPRRPNSPSDSS